MQNRLTQYSVDVQNRLSQYSTCVQNWLYLTWLVVVGVARGVAVHLNRPRGQPGGVAMMAAVHGVSSVVTPPGAPPPVWRGREGPGGVPRPLLLIVVTKHLYRGPVLHQSEASVQVMWSLSTNQRPVSRSCDHSQGLDTRLCLLFIIGLWSAGGACSLRHWTQS